MGETPDGSRGLIGERLGNYRLIEMLGFGSMGQVYLAKHDLMGRKAAIKVLNEELSANGDVVERFLNEARAVNEIRHPHVVEITDFGQVEGRYYLIMELLEGETLASCLEQCARLEAPQAVHIAGQVASALQAAHERGIVHRDLKPDNIFLSAHAAYPDYVKVLDFGVAKLMSKRQDVRVRKTEIGTLLGTPHYMSPEQCLGEQEVGPASDVYALGVLLYEMTTGELPFDAENLSQLLLAQVNERPVPPSQRAMDLPRFVENAILRALEKRPEDRFATMRAMRAALLCEPELSSEPEPAARPEPSVPPQLADEEPATISLAPADQATKKGLGAAATLAAPPPRQYAAVVAPTPVPIVPAEDHDDECGLSAGDEERPQRVGHKLARILMERVQSKNLVLPMMPQVAVECMQQIGDQQATFSHLAKTLEKDPMLATQVLRVANNVAFASAEKARTLEQAVSRLGGRQLRTLLIELSAHQVFQSRERRIRDAFNGIWEHSMAVALLSRAISKQVGKGDAELAHLAGLLHDLGKPMVGSMLLEAERQLSKREERFMTPGLWMKVVEDSHRDVGIAIVQAWKMPEEVVETVERCGELDEAYPYRICNFVTVANALAKQAGHVTGTAILDGNEALLARGLDMYEIDPQGAEALVASLTTQVGGSGHGKARAAG
ncbi:MAG: HDOD domain-containing protein [Myxococcales bacterium]|nr:HDOD domain-containing protein [Myxococcales bacterium]